MLLLSSESTSIFLVGRNELVDCDLLSFSVFLTFFRDLALFACDISILNLIPPYLKKSQKNKVFN